MPDRAEILATAEELVNGDRAQTYGPPEASFGRIGRLWAAQLDLPDDTFPPATVALMLAQLKVSRIVSSPDHADSWVDLAGYASLGGEMATKGGSDA